MDWRAGIGPPQKERGARYLPTKIARRAGHLKFFFKCPGVCPGGGMLKAICQDLCFNRHIQFSAASPTKNTARQEMRVSEEHGQRNKNN